MEEIENIKFKYAELELQLSKRTEELTDALVRLEDASNLIWQTRQYQKSLTRMLSHELRTPLSLVDSMAMNIELDLPTSAEALRMRCNRIRRTVDQLINLIQTCLSAINCFGNPAGVSREEADVCNMVYEAHDAARSISTRHKFHMNLEDLPDTILCDPVLTSLALRAFACNAVTYTPAGTNINFNGRLDDGGFILEVSDDGPGVSDKDFPFLFEQNFRGENSNTSLGDGLGLALAREMIERQGGVVEAFNNQGVGFSVQMWLPRVIQR